MIRRALLRILMSTPLAGWLRPWMPVASVGGAAAEGPDAAAIYRRAFDWSTAVRSADSSLLREGAAVAIDGPRLDSLIRRARPALEAILEAASVGRCRWDGEVTSLDDLCKGHLDASHVNVVRVACLSARRHLKSGRGRDALDEVFAALTLAHRVGTGGVIFARVLECSGEVTAFRTLGQVLRQMDRATLEDLSGRLSAFPPPAPASATIGPESRFILGSLRTKLTAAGPMIEGSEWGEVGFDDEAAATLKRLTGGDRSRLLRHLETTKPAFEELARRLDLPRPTCRAALDEFAEAERATQPIAAGLAEVAWSLRHVVDRMRAFRSMLHAGLVLVRDGEEAFLGVPDPFGAGAFGLEPRGKGHLIRSAMNDEERPEVSLEIGDAA